MVGVVDAVETRSLVSDLEASGLLEGELLVALVMEHLCGDEDDITKRKSDRERH